MESARLGSRCVVVRVGTEDLGNGVQDFLVHEQMIRTASPFLDAVLKRGWQESMEPVVKLPKDDPECFGIHLQWLYAGKIFTRDELNTAPASPARRLVVDIAVWERSNEAFENIRKHAPPADFLIDLSLELPELRVKGRSSASPIKRYTFRYREHTALNKPCYRTTRNS